MIWKKVKWARQLRNRYRSDVHRAPCLFQGDPCREFFVWIYIVSSVDKLVISSKVAIQTRLDLVFCKNGVDVVVIVEVHRVDHTIWRHASWLDLSLLIIIYKCGYGIGYRYVMSADYNHCRCRVDLGGSQIATNRTSPTKHACALRLAFSLPLTPGYFRNQGIYFFYMIEVLRVMRFLLEMCIDYAKFTSDRTKYIA